MRFVWLKPGVLYSEKGLENVVFKQGPRETHRRLEFAVGLDFVRALCFCCSMVPFVGDVFKFDVGPLLSVSPGLFRRPVPEVPAAWCMFVNCFPFSSFLTLEYMAPLLVHFVCSVPGLSLVAFFRAGFCRYLLDHPCFRDWRVLIAL